MKIGLTYDLRSDYLKEGYSMEETAEFDKEETIIGIEEALKCNGYQTERIGHARKLMQELLKGKRWDMVFNISEGMYGDSRESLVPALLDAYQIPHVFSGAVTLGISLNKAFAKQIVRDAGVNTPPFMVVYQPDDVKHSTLTYPLFAKPIAEGTGKGIEGRSVINTPEQLAEICQYLLKKFNQPVLVEEYLPGREFTVGVVGNGTDARVVGAMELIYNEGIDNVYSYFNKENYEGRIHYQPVTGEWLAQCADVTLKAWNALKAFDGGRVDVRVDRHGKVSFIEINPLAGLNPVHSDLPILCRMNNIEYNQLIGMIMEAAIKRIQSNHGK
ncbi:MAG TPA: ATP-grasp domain-containing protein [Bacteroidales bacterium]|nr:ATP-grasp domain-containing protein [Bacteroidales bacterium]